MYISVVIPTYNRQECFPENLDFLAAQGVTIKQVVIIDASEGTATEVAVRERVKRGLPFEVIYRQNPRGRGNTPNSRNMALELVNSPLIAFLDDDAFPREGWAQAMLETFDDASIAGVVGRALNGFPHELLITTSEVGKISKYGTVIGNFNSNVENILDVDHMIGCNSMWRASALAILGGQLDDWNLGKQCLMEETETCLRARRLGMRLVYNPFAVVDHRGSPQPGGKRFSPKYSYYHTRNNMMMLIRNFGFRTTAQRFIWYVSAVAIGTAMRKVAGAVVHLLCTLCGLGAGLICGLYWRFQCSESPARANGNSKHVSDNLAKIANSFEESDRCTRIVD